MKRIHLYSDVTSDEEGIFNYKSTQIQESDNGEYVLLDFREHEQIKNAIIALQEQVHNLKRSLRAVCIDTENPIHF
jgi:hypothetical protein